MGSPSSIKTPNSLHVLATNSMKLKTLLQTLIFSKIYRISCKAKSVLFNLIGEILHLDVHLLQELPLMKKNKKNKLIFGSFRLHYNWCSSHVMPINQESCNPTSHDYYDSSWNISVIPETKSLDDDHEDTFELSRYLEWLEEKGKNNIQESNEIDKLADLFIANCHEKFRLEKQESYRRFQEMMARSV